MNSEHRDLKWISIPSYPRRLVLPQIGTWQFANLLYCTHWRLSYYLIFEKKFFNVPKIQIRLIKQWNTKFNLRGTQLTGTKRPLHSTTQLLSPPTFSVIREWPPECFQNFRKQQIRCGRSYKTDPILLRFEATQASSMARKSSKVQALYELCQTVFTPSGSPPPSSPAINKLRSVLGTFP